MTYEIEFFFIFHKHLFWMQVYITLYVSVQFSKLTTWQESIAFAPQTYIVLKSLDASGL